MSYLDPNEYHLLVDIETTGLSPRSDELLEVGFMVVDLALKPIEMLSFVIIPDEGVDWTQVDDYVRNMHFDNGLSLLINKGQGESIGDAESLFANWYVDLFGETKMPLAGSSVQFDRGFLEEFMPGFTALLSYRNEDISSVKEICRRHNPEVYSKLGDYNKRDIHRVIPDLEDTISEFQFYIDNFLMVTRPEL